MVILEYNVYFTFNNKNNQDPVYTAKSIHSMLVQELQCVVATHFSFLRIFLPSLLTKRGTFLVLKCILLIQLKIFFC